jgi:hypothetical protein
MIVELCLRLKPGNYLSTSAMSKPGFYAVNKGHRIGVFTTWYASLWASIQTIVMICPEYCPFSGKSVLPASVDILDRSIRSLRIK